MSETLSVVHVVIPAHDEEALLPACLTSVLGALDRLVSGRGDVDARLTVVLDSCTDTSAALCRSYAVDVIEVGHANVGRARASGTDHAATRAATESVRPEAVWIACTDADSIVPADWLVDQIEVAEAGADVVLGRVEPDATADEGVVARWHALHDDGRVGVHGAHLGFRLSAYEAVGGWAPLPEREDLDLVQRLLASGARYGAATRPVLTSSRLVGRTDGGFAGFLAGLVTDLDRPFGQPATMSG